VKLALPLNNIYCAKSRKSQILILSLQNIGASLNLFENSEKKAQTSRMSRSLGQNSECSSFANETVQFRPKQK